MVGTSGEEAEGFQLSDATGGRSMLEGGFLSLNACVEQIPLSPPLGTINPRFSPNVRRNQYLSSLNIWVLHLKLQESSRASNVTNSST